MAVPTMVRFRTHWMSPYTATATPITSSRYTGTGAPRTATWASMGIPMGRGTRPHRYLMAPTPAMSTPKEVIMVKVISRA
jgi:hypothetical protein